MASALDLLGWLGGGVVAVAYGLVSTRRVAPDATLFQALNIAGATMLGVACFHSGALPSAFMNILWIGFGVQSLATAGQRRRLRASRPPAGGGLVRGRCSDVGEPAPADVVLDAA